MRITSLSTSSSNPERLNIMKKSYIVMAVLATAALASCQQEKSLDDAKKVEKNEIVFTFKSGATKAEVAPAVRQGVVIPIESEVEGVNLFLEETIVNLNDLSSAPATKGTPAYTENVGVLYKDNLNVWADGLGDATYASMDKEMYDRKDATQEVPNKGWRYNHVYAKDPWTGGEVAFYLNMPAAPKNVTFGDNARANGKFTFSYTSPDKAADQEDIIFAYRTLTKEQHNGYLPNGAPVLFNHALTAVKFAIGNEAADIQNNQVAIKEVIFNNLQNSGTCVITPVGATDDDPNADYRDKIDEYTSSDGRVVWTLPTTSSVNTITSDPYDGTTTFAENTASSFGPGKGDYPKSFADGGNENNLGGPDGSQIFWLIPQSFDASSTVTLTINYTFGGVEGTATIDFGKALAGVNWQAGELRTYTLRVDEVNVHITDQFTSTVKDNVVITNTGNTAAFIRAAIIGQWVDQNGKPVFGYTNYKDGLPEPAEIKSWYDDFANGGTYFGTFDTLPGTDWVKGTDGYFYYTKPVEPGISLRSVATGETTDDINAPLFKKYTVNTANAPKMKVGGIEVSTTLLMDISAQAISAKKVNMEYYEWNEAWENALRYDPSK